MELYDNGSFFFFSKRFSHFSANPHTYHEAGVEAAAPQARNLRFEITEFLLSVIGQLST